jgi:hypothetical protein
VEARHGGGIGMRQAIAATACMALLAACGPEGATSRQTGAPGHTAAGDTAAGLTDSTGAGTSGTGTTGAQAGGSGSPAASEDGRTQARPGPD